MAQKYGRKRCVRCGWVGRVRPRERRCKQRQIAGGYACWGRLAPVVRPRAALVLWLIGEGYTKLAAEKFADGGWAPSMMIGGGRVVQDIQSLDMEGADGSRKA